MNGVDRTIHKHMQIEIYWSDYRLVRLVRLPVGRLMSFLNRELIEKRSAAYR